MAEWERCTGLADTCVLAAGHEGPHARGEAVGEAEAVALVVDVLVGAAEDAAADPAYRAFAQRFRALVEGG